MNATAIDTLTVANQVLQTFAWESRIEQRPGGWYVCWRSYDGKRIYSRRWQARGQDFYPVWSRIWPHGGTACTALSQLIRWVQGRPVLPLSTWRYWMGDRVKLGQPSAIELLRDAGYPETVNCVLCGQPIAGGLDWWSLNGVSGPCCEWRSGCRQEGKKA